jgi:hypothetical protein
LKLRKGISLLGFMEVAMKIVDEERQPHIHSLFDKLTDAFF